MKLFTINCARCFALIIACVITIAGLAMDSAMAAPPNNCDRCFAMVKYDGSIEHSRNLQAISKLGTGWYRLTFKYQIKNCAINSTADTLTPGAGIVFVYLSLSRITNRMVDVFVAAHPNTNYRDYPFSLAVAC